MPHLEAAPDIHASSARVNSAYAPLAPSHLYKPLSMPSSCRRGWLTKDDITTFAIALGCSFLIRSCVVPPSLPVVAVYRGAVQRVHGA